jgi:primary-amine oxidase
MAPFHQQVFSLRIDPCIDRGKNSFVEEDSIAMPMDEKTPFGVGYVTENKVLSKSTPSDSAPNRAQKIMKLFPGSTNLWESQLNTS